MNRITDHNSIDIRRRLLKYIYSVATIVGDATPGHKKIEVVYLRVKTPGLLVTGKHH